MPSLRTVDAAGVALAALTAAAGGALWSALPAEMAVHFDASGTPDNYVPKAVGVFLLPALTVGTLAVVNVAARYDPPDSHLVFRVVKLWTAGVLAYVQGFVLAWNLGYEAPMVAVLGPVLASAAALVVWSYRTERRAAG